MKLNKYVTFSSCLLALSLLIGCAKEETTNVQTTSNGTTQSNIAADDVTLNNEFDQFADEALQVISNRKVSIYGASIDTSQITLGVITIYYSGKEADGTKSRSGSDSIHLSMVGGHIVPWGTPGTTASITLGCINSPGYELTFLNGNTSLRLNGTCTLTNVSGGYYQSLVRGDSLVENIQGSMEFTFNDNAASIVYYPFNVNETRSFTKPDSISATTRGNATMAGYTQVANWGEDRFGNTYYACIAANVVQNISIATLSYNPLSGMKNIEGISEPIQCTYGVNSAGNAVTSGTPYGVVINWSNNGGVATAVIPYYY